jgi:iron complex outermembrane recepter protein
MSFKRERRTAVMMLCVLLGCVVSQADPSAEGTSLRGTVLDSSGRSVSSARVVVTNERDAGHRETATDSNGRFSVPGVAAGAYAIEVSAQGFATVRAEAKVTDDAAQDVAITLSPARRTEEVTVSETLPQSVKKAPVHTPLSARSAESVVSETFVRDYTAPNADYSQVVQMTPGAFSWSANGVGLGDTKTFFRGFQDGQYTMTFDGIPFNDSNDPTHHSWAFFPSQFTGGAVFDRSPGSAATIGPANFGGSINLLSRSPRTDGTFNATASYGSFNTRLFDLEYEGRLGASGKSQLVLDVHNMQSDGYQTFNFQKRNAVSGKYQYAVSDKTTLTVFGSYVDLTSNTPDTNQPTRAAVAANGDNFLLTNDPSSPLYYGYNTYDVPTDFEYVGWKTDLGHGWSIDDKLYTYYYHNQENFNSPTKISTTSGTDKLNGYRKYGNLLPITQTSSLGTLRAGLWSEYSNSDRHQIPSDPRTLIDAALPNFHETYDTTILEPYAEYGLKATGALTITPGVKLSYYKQDFVQYADNGKKIGDLGGLPSVSHTGSYHSWLPSLDAHYLLRSNWSAYAQYATGDVIPPTSVFDVTNAAVSVLPKPTLTKTFQVGTVWTSERATFSVDAYTTRLDNSYSASFDQTASETTYFPSGRSTFRGIEAETNLLVGGGMSVYANGTVGRAEYADTGLRVQNAPGDTETLGLMYQAPRVSIGAFAKRVGSMYNDNGSVHQAVAIDPFTIANAFVNLSIHNSSRFSETKIKLGVNNIFDDHNIVAVSPASKTSLADPNDLLTLLPGRSVSLAVTVAFSPKAHQ